MAISGFESIVTSGLVFCLDATDRSSYFSGSSIWNDLTANGNSGSVINSPTYSVDALGSIIFDGFNDYVTGSSVNFPIGSSNRTFSCWFKTSRVLPTNQFHVLFIYGSQTTNGCFFVGIGGDANSPGVNPANRFACSQFGNNVGSFQTVNDGQWKNGVVTVNSSLYSLYINGVFDNSKTMTTNTVNTSFMVGYDNLNLYFSGSLSNILLYDRALSATEILQNYLAQKSKFGL